MEKIRGLFEKIPDSGVWWISWQDANGKQHREKIGRRKDAIDLLAKRRTETLQRKKLPERFRQAGVTFKQLCDDAIEYSKHSNTPKSTHELQLKIDAMLPEFSDRKADEITKQEIVRWLAHQAESREWKASSRNRWQAAFSLIFRVGIDNEKITRNPAAKIRRKQEDNGRVRFLTDEEENKLRASISTLRLQAAFDLSVYTGMRQGEQFSLQKRQIDHTLKQVHLPKTKNGKPRRIPLNKTAMEAIEVLLTDNKSKYVFPNGRKDGDAVQGARGWFPDSVSRAGIEDYTWHDNRHTFASRLVMAGTDLRTVADLLGHRSLQMVMRYTHLAPEHNAAAVARVERKAPVQHQQGTEDS
jgi:site-specific recombinase XerD